jgi:hypothetical protein
VGFVVFHTEALRLEELLAGRGLAVRVGRASLDDHAMRFPLQLGLGATTRRLLTLTNDLAKEAGYSACRLRREGSTLFLELPRNEGAGLRYGDLLEMTGTLPLGSALVGQMEQGGSLTLNITDPATPHLLIRGARGTGKSELLRVLALGMACHHSARHWRMALLTNDPATPLTPLKPLAHTWAFGTQAELSLGWLVRLVHEVGERERNDIVTPQVLVMIDNAERLLELGGRIAHSLLAALLRRGAGVGVHVVVAATQLPSDLVDLFPAQLQSATEGGAGRFTVTTATGSAPMWAARLDESEVQAVVGQLHAQRTRVIAQRTALGS